MELKCITLRKEFFMLREEVKSVNSLIEATEIYGSPSVLIVRVTELEDSLEGVDKRY